MTTNWLRFDRDVVLRAGAGAGKTHALVTLYLHLLAGATARRRPIAPGGIVAISFTEKAASELSERIRQRLSRLASGDVGGEAELVVAAEALDVKLPDADGWERCLQQLGGAPVGTFHRLGGALLRRHAVAARVDPAYHQLDEQEATERLRTAAERATLSALEAGDEAARALAVELGFGSGRFTVGLVDLLVQLHQRRAEEGLGAAGLDANYGREALAAGWRDAGTELVDAARSLMALPGLGPRWVELQRELAGGIDALAAAMEAAGRSTAASAVSTGLSLGDKHATDGAMAAARDLIGPVVGAGAQGPGVKAAKERLDGALEALAAAHRGAHAAPLAAALTRLLDDTTRRYAADKRRIGALDFADLIVRTRDLLRDDPDVLAAERARCEVLLVDEFQDTNAVQAELVRLLAGPPGARPGGAGRLLVVGDRKQSIYEFRGADVGVFVALEEDVQGGGGARGVLGRSFRSRPSLVRLANALFARTFATTGPGGPRAPRWRIAWDPTTDALEPARLGDDEPAAELLAVTTDGSAERRRFAEARALAARLAALHNEGSGARPRDVALLLRSFTWLDVYLDALRTAGVPHYVVNGRGFFEAQEVRDLAAALRLLDDPDDRLALVTVLRSPLAHQSDETLLALQLAGLLRLEPIVAGRALAALPAPAGDDQVRERRRLERFAHLVADLRRRADRLGPHDLLRALADATDLEAVLAAGYQGEQRVANLMALLERARAAEETGVDLRAFVRQLSELTEPGVGDREAQAQLAAERGDVVRVMTVHQSKGLEFAVVAVAACGAGEQYDRGPVLYDADAGLGLKLRDGADLHDTGPSRLVAGTRQAKAQAESLRLFYVAATRARDLLILSGEAARPGGTSWRALVDRAISEDPEVASRIRVVTAGEPAAPAITRERVLPDGEPLPCRALLERAAAAPPPPPPTAITVAVTQLADFALCPRRHHLLHAVGLAEHPRAARPPSPDSVDPELDPLARGTLAHRLLELADPARAGGDLDAILVAGGYDPEAADVAEVKAHAARFLATPFSRALAAEGEFVEVRRELPFLLVEPGSHGAQVRLRGQIDLLVLERRTRTVTVVDYKHARAGDGDDYRFQLEAYALAAHRLVRDATRVQVGLAFLREADPSPRLADHPIAAIERFGQRVGDIGGELARARAAGQYEGRPEGYCRAAGCGYLARCHPG